MDARDCTNCSDRAPASERSGLHGRWQPGRHGARRRKLRTSSGPRPSRARNRGRDERDATVKAGKRARNGCHGPRCRLGRSRQPTTPAARTGQPLSARISTRPPRFLPAGPAARAADCRRTRGCDWSPPGLRPIVCDPGGKLENAAGHVVPAPQPQGGSTGSLGEPLPGLGVQVQQLAQPGAEIPGVTACEGRQVRRCGGYSPCRPAAISAGPEGRATSGGEPHAAASAATMPNTSGKTDGTTLTSASGHRCARWRCCSGPVNRTSGPARAASSARAGPGRGPPPLPGRPLPAEPPAAARPPSRR